MFKLPIGRKSSSKMEGTSFFAASFLSDRAKERAEGGVGCSGHIIASSIVLCAERSSPNAAGVVGSW